MTQAFQPQEGWKREIYNEPSVSWTRFLVMKIFSVEGRLLISRQLKTCKIHSSGSPCSRISPGYTYFSECYHGTIMQTRITCKKIPLRKSSEFGMDLKYSTTRYKQKTDILLVTRPPTCWKPVSYFRPARIDKKRIKASL